MATYLGQVNKKKTYTMYEEMFEGGGGESGNFEDNITANFLN